MRVMSVVPQSSEGLQLTFLITASALANSWSGSCFGMKFTPSASTVTSGLDDSRFTETESTLRRGGTSTQNDVDFRFVGRGLG